MERDPFSLNGRAALVTGGSRGIGAAIVEALAMHGARAVFCHLGDDQKAAEFTDRLAQRGFDCRGMECDVADETEVGGLARWAHDELGQIDILVNCAGAGGGAPFLDLSVAAWDRMIAVHLRGTFLVTRAFFGGMVERRDGRVINVASQLAFRGGAEVAHYCAAKAGIVGFTRALAREGAPHGVLVNAIAPGPVETDLIREMSPEWRAQKKKKRRSGVSPSRMRLRRPCCCSPRTPGLTMLDRRCRPTAAT